MLIHNRIGDLCRMGEFAERLWVRIRERRDKYLSVLEDLLVFPSVSATGEGMESAADRVAQVVEAAGLRCDIFRDVTPYPIVWGELREERHGTLLLYNHYDVQPADPLEGWVSDPFKPSIREGRVYARGSCDNKGNLAARLCAVDLFMDMFGEIPINLKLLVEGGEEIGSPGLDLFFEKHREILGADACLWEMGGSTPGGRPIIYLGAKGILYLEIILSESRPDLHSSWGSIVRNPAIELAHAISSMRGLDGTVTIEGFYEDVEEPDAQTISLLEGLDAAESEVLGAAGREGLITDRPLKEQLVELLLKPCINVCGLHAGYTGRGSKTVLPSRAYAKIDVRLVPKMDPGKVYELIRRHVERATRGRAEVKAIDRGYPAARTHPSEPFVELVRVTAEAAYGGKPLLYPSSAGSGPMYLVTELLGIPCVATGVGDYLSNIHAPNESISIDGYLRGILHVALILANFVPYMRSGVAPYI